MDHTNVIEPTDSKRAAKLRIMSLAIVLLILIIDQCIKIWVKTHMCLGEKIEITDWAYIAFTENRGMAFGMEFVGTLLLCCFRIIAIGALVWALLKVTLKPYVKWGMVALMAMVLAGAAGNILDNIFYGLIFDDSNYFEPAKLVALGQGSGNLFEGRVVDMFYFPIIDTILPEWFPIAGGSHFIFFSPIFNFADASISTGGVLLVTCYYKTLNRLFARNNSDSNTDNK